MLLRNARVFDAPGANSVLIDGQRIVAVGRDLAGSPAIDLRGQLLTPGLNDAHLHLMRGASLRIELDLRGVESPAAMQAKIRDRAATTREREWITGRGWDHTLWPGQAWPTRALLDAASAAHPMYFSRVDIHAAVANSRALAIAGVAERFPDGLLFETDMALVRRAIPVHNKDRRKAALLETLQDFARFGITSCQDNSTWDDFLLYRELEQEGRWTVRVSEWLDFLAPLAELQEKRAVASPLLRTGLAKGFSDVWDRAPRRCSNRTPTTRVRAESYGSILRKRAGACMISTPLDFRLACTPSAMPRFACASMHFPAPKENATASNTRKSSPTPTCRGSPNTT